MVGFLCCPGAGRCDPAARAVAAGLVLSLGLLRAGATTCFVATNGSDAGLGRRPGLSLRRFKINVCKFILAVVMAAPAVAFAQNVTIYPVYSNSLVNGWVDSSWATVSYSNTSPVYSGSEYSISVTMSNAWGGIEFLHSDMTITPYATLSFWLNGGASGGQHLQVFAALDINGTNTPQSGRYYLSAPASNAWQQYIVPLSTLGLTNQTNVSGFAIQDSAGTAEPVFYLDDVQLNSTPHAGGTTYFVATNGSDTNAGTSLAAPFQTIQHAAATAVAGDTCYIRAGVYHETLAPSSVGTSSAPITFAAWSNEVVTLDAADAVTGWTYLSNGIYQATVNWDLGEGFNQVFVDGAMVHQAQYPAYGSGDVMHPGLASVTVGSANTNVITSAAWSGQPVNYWAGAWFVGGVGLSWGWQSALVLFSSGSNITVIPWTETGGWWFTGSGNGYLFGRLSFLNADNEWHLQSNTLYLRITGSGNPSAHTVEMKHRNWCVNLNYLNYITVSNLNLWGGAVLFQGNGNALLNCQAQYLSHFMIITNAYYEDGGSQAGAGVAIAGNNNIVRRCALCNTAGSGVCVYGGGSNLITRNVISNTDYSGTYACAIALHGTGDIVTFNTAHTSGRDILRPEGAGSVICFNDLAYPRLLCRDLGVIYVWGVNAQAPGGADTRIAYNWIHDNDYPLPCALIYLDNYDANFVVDHNVIWNTGGDSGVRINGPACGHLIYNNTLFNCADVGTYPYDDYPTSNPDPAFWTNDIYQYSASNNLFLSNSPQTQLVNWTNNNFSLLPNAPAVNAGVVIPGFTDGYVGSAPDLGAYELGSPPWNAGVGSQPTLAIAGAGAGCVTLTASPDAAYYGLYTATNPGPPGLWTPATNAPVVSGDQWYVTVSTANDATRFYRLQGQ
jgi:hypothetical protein